MPKEKPKVNIGEVIRSYRGQRGLSQGDIERRTGLLRCYLSRVENGHTVPSLETLAKIAEAMEIALADFFPGAETPRDRDTQKMLGELSEDEIRFLSEIKKYSTTLSDGDKRLVLAMIRKMATVIPPPPRKVYRAAHRVLVLIPKFLTRECLDRASVCAFSAKRAFLRQWRQIESARRWYGICARARSRRPRSGLPLRRSVAGRRFPRAWRRQSRSLRRARP